MPFIFWVLQLTSGLNLLILTAAEGVLSQWENATLQNNLFPLCQEHLEGGGPKVCGSAGSNAAT